MFAVLLLTSALALPEATPAQVADRIADAQASYRDCIADTIAARPQDEGNDLALSAALERCRDAEIALRTQTKMAPDATTADTLAIVVDTRMDGVETGLRRRQTQ
ncbi:hypothetical protein KRR38_15240 [Novosphingobium sp. G106]|uniref:hypothetical protein n=1 Tax=Novosphingobium sp. G106 TaxID=2849500 RepID=UPI001C2D1014|nr:hypothetical protein [Novosphingobium sp. G106]MBV1688988.1 hypothetical protein [Novosphingobium sp. G106]